MKKLSKAGLLAAFLAVASLGDAQQPPVPALRPLTFLSGRWVSQKGAEVQEENWSPVSGDSMIGSFRVVQEGKAVFYEFWAVEVEDHRPVLKLKHFGANLAGWEEKNVSTRMPLISTAEGDAVFAEADGSVSLHYHRTVDTLTCTVHHVRDGKASDETFSLNRIPTP